MIVVAVCGSGRSWPQRGWWRFQRVTLAERSDSGNHQLRQKCAEEKPPAGEAPRWLPSMRSRLSQIQRRSRALCLERQPALLVLLQPDQ